jgi:hypothetical protein
MLLPGEARFHPKCGSVPELRLRTMVQSFALMGAGYVAPRHMQAIMIDVLIHVRHCRSD